MCENDQVSVIQDGCWVCVSQTTCEPISMLPQETCTTNAECDLGEYCDECAGGSSCPDCTDCIGLCVASSCASEDSALCEVEPPICEPSSILVVQNECWLCVDQSTCEPTPPVSEK